MFTESDYISYFEKIEEVIKNTLTIYTDLLNELNDQSIRNKLYALLTEKMDAYKFVKSQKNKFI